MALAASLLSDHAVHLGNQTSPRAWEFPEIWTQEERAKFVKEFHDWNGSPENFDLGALHLPDGGVAAFLAYKLMGAK